MAAFARPFVPLLSQFGARETVELRRVVKGAGVNTGGRLVDIVTAASSSVDQVVAAIGTLPHMCSCCCGCMRACGCTCVVVCVAVCGCGVHGPFVDVIVRLVAFVNARNACACQRGWCIDAWMGTDHSIGRCQSLSAFATLSALRSVVSVRMVVRVRGSTRAAALTRSSPLPRARPCSGSTWRPCQGVWCESGSWSTWSTPWMR